MNQKMIGVSGHFEPSLIYVRKIEITNNWLLLSGWGTQLFNGRNGSTTLISIYHEPKMSGVRALFADILNQV
jgi:hypothetical protein